MEKHGALHHNSGVFLQRRFCATDPEKDGSRGGSFPRTLECYRLSPHHPSCPEQQKPGKSTAALLSGNSCSAVMMNIFSYCVCMCIIEWIAAKPQAVSDSVQGVGVLSGRLGQRILQLEGAHRQPQDVCTQVWFGKLYSQKVLFAKAVRFVLAGRVYFMPKSSCMVWGHSAFWVNYFLTWVLYVLCREIQPSGEERGCWSWCSGWPTVPEHNPPLPPDQGRRNQKGDSLPPWHHLFPPD